MDNRTTGTRRRAPGHGAPRRTSSAGQARIDRITIDGGSPLIRAARVFATRSHAGQRRDSDGAPFIEHPLDVARLLRDAGCSDVVVAAGLLHDVLENTPVRADELVARFGANVASLVSAVTDDAQINGYRERKLRLREQVRKTGGDAAVLFAADKICRLGELDVASDRRDAPGAGVPDEQLRRLRLEHYRASLEMLQTVAPRHPLVGRLADVLADVATADVSPA